MGTASSGEWIAILLYFALVIGVGVYFFFRDRNQEGEKEYFLGGRSMGGWVAALSAGASGYERVGAHGSARLDLSVRHR